MEAAQQQEAEELPSPAPPLPAAAVSGTADLTTTAAGTSARRVRPEDVMYVRRRSGDWDEVERAQQGHDTTSEGGG